MEKTQVTLKHKLIIFITFSVLMSIISIWFSNELLHVETVIGPTNDLIVDGTDFTPLVNSVLHGFSFGITIASIIITSIINTCLILIITVIFNKFYFKTSCSEKDDLKKHLKKVIWGFFTIGTVLLLALNPDQDFTLICFTILLVYLPLPLITSLLVFGKLKKTP